MIDHPGVIDQLLMPLRSSFADSKTFEVEQLGAYLVDDGIHLAKRSVDRRQMYAPLMIVTVDLMDLMDGMLPEQMLARCQLENSIVVVAPSLGMRHCRWVYEMVGVMWSMETRLSSTDCSRYLAVMAAG